MDKRLPIPKNWQDFESLCCRLWSEIWSDPNAQKHGRQGQPQCGVDVYGRPIYSEHYHGIQCKDKDSRLGSVLTTKEISEESKKALSFKPSISTYTLATTSPKSEKNQKFCRELNEEKAFPFSVNVWSWDDIESEIIYRPTILNHFYSDIVIPKKNTNTIKLNRFSTKDQFYAFFSRPEIIGTISNQFKKLLIPLVYELMDNAYLHGKATQYEIRVEKNKIKLIDDGVKFNPIRNLDASKTSAKSHIGSFIFETFIDELKDNVKANYSRSNESNILELIFNKTILNIDNENHYELNIDLKEAYGREKAKALASKIPIDKNEIILNINSISNLSVSVEFIREALNRLNKNQTLTMFIPRHSYLTGFQTWFNDKRLKIRIR